MLHIQPPFSIPRPDNVQSVKTSDPAGASPSEEASCAMASPEPEAPTVDKHGRLSVVAMGQMFAGELCP